MEKHWRIGIMSKMIVRISACTLVTFSMIMVGILLLLLG